ncbi:hypothetical protein [Salininema proteolyticum]|uniref:Uncharacterized protein n=1 Tax=Salininema proteolyticum TaxID=1607685 RepID=A0ABV8TZ72_9ACTN
MVAVIPRAFHGLVDDAAVFPPGNAALPDALENHHRYRESWYSDLVGPLLLPASRLAEVPALTEKPPAVGVVADTDPRTIDIPDSLIVTHFETRAPLADDLRLAARGLPGHEQPVITEIPWGDGQRDLLRLALDLGLTPKFRTGGLDASAFPEPEELGHVVWACMEAESGFKLTAGLHRAVRHTEDDTGFVHHGFLNVLAATQCDSEREVVDMLRSTDADEIASAVRLHMSRPRNHWVAFGSCSVAEPLEDLEAMSLVEEIR